MIASDCNKLQRATWLDLPVERWQRNLKTIKRVSIKKKTGVKAKVKETAASSVLIDGLRAASQQNRFSGLWH